MDKITIFRAELHIHTPASKCYKGPKNDEEYISILKRAKEKNLNVIAITDHNSIEGYKRVVQIIEKSKNDLDTLQTITDSIDAKKRVKELNRFLKCLESVLILPGVEFEVNNGIHLLVIFNPNTSINDIEKFLNEGGYNEDSFGKENDVFSNWSIFDLYRESQKYDCVILDAHTDSSKGIYNTLQEGTTRAHAFSDSALRGICYKSEKQKYNIQHLLASPQYQRKSPVAFLKASDAHCINEIGRDQTFFNIDKLDWESIKSAFDNPNECIFTTFPETQIIINNVSQTELCLCVPNANENSLEQLLKSFCALANSMGGFIIVGADSIDLINGVVIDGEDEFKRFIDFIHDSSRRISGLVISSINPYPIKDERYIFIVRIKGHDNLVDVDNNGYIYQAKNNKIKLLNAHEIDCLIKQRMNKKITDVLFTELNAINTRTSYIESYLQSIPILSSYEELSENLLSLVSLNIVDPFPLSDQQRKSVVEKFETCTNGKSRGNVFYFESFQKPRLQDAYLRITIPKFAVKGLKSLDHKPSIYIVPGGAVYYSEKIMHCYNRMGVPVLRIAPRGQYPIKFLCAFLKSSFFLWLLKNKYDDFNLYRKEIMTTIQVPKIHVNNPSENSLIQGIESEFDEICKIEQAFLKKEVKNYKDFVSETQSHNKRTQELFYKIDEKIYELLRLKKDEIETINKNLKASNVFL